MRGSTQIRKLAILFLMAATVVAVVAYGTAVAANLAHTPMSDPENPDASPSPAVQFTLNVHVVGSADGQVAMSDSLGTCSSTCTVPVDAGTEVRLRAQPAPGARFHEWGGACHGKGDECEVNMVRDRVVVAVFTKGDERLEVSHEGHGRVTNHGGVDCPPDCGQSYAAGSTVHLFHHASSGWRFAGWSGACHGRGVCSVHMNGPRVVRATFTHGAPAGRHGGGSHHSGHTHPHHHGNHHKHHHHHGHHHHHKHHHHHPKQ